MRIPMKLISHSASGTIVIWVIYIKIHFPRATTTLAEYSVPTPFKYLVLDPQQRIFRPYVVHVVVSLLLLFVSAHRMIRVVSQHFHTIEIFVKVSLILKFNRCPNQ